MCCYIHKEMKLTWHFKSSIVSKNKCNVRSMHAAELFRSIKRRDLWIHFHWFSSTTGQFLIAPATARFNLQMTQLTKHTTCTRFCTKSVPVWKEKIYSQQSYKVRPRFVSYLGLKFLCAYQWRSSHWNCHHRQVIFLQMWSQPGRSHPDLSSLACCHPAKVNLVSTARP